MMLMLIGVGFSKGWYGRNFASGSVEYCSCCVCVHVGGGGVCVCDRGNTTAWCEMIINYA